MKYSLQLILDFIKKNIYPILLVLISIVLFFCNYTPGTWLSGWDTLHPEMNLPEYLKRIFESVWQEHQGLGAVATQAHASEILRMLILIPLIVLLPIEAVRWGYLFLMLVLGPLGVYFLVLKLAESEKYNKSAAFISGLFFLCNLGTMQTFFAPLEMFITLYGFIGWQFLTIYNFINNRSWKTFAAFAIVTMLITPTAHTPTLWFVNLIMIFAYLGILLLLSLSKFKTLKKNIITTIYIAVTILILNLYWLMPTLYFMVYHADDVSSAKITRLVSEEGILNNQEYASVQDISILKGYLFNWRVHTGDEKFVPIFSEWYSFDQKANSDVLRYLLFGIVIFGIVSTIFFKKFHILPFLSIFLLSFFFLLMDSPPFGLIFMLIQNHIPLIKEALRFPYTKFSIPLFFTFSIFFGYGFWGLIKLASKIEWMKKAVFIGLIYLILIFVILFQFMPAFRGNFIGKIERVNIPDNYNQLFTYLNKIDDARIAVIPANTMFGWVYYDWENPEKIDASYQGAGFIWFLSKNPIMDREFDRWYPTNEDFYNEYSYAIYSKDLQLLKYVLSKYGVNYLIIDNSLINPGSSKSLQTESIEKLLQSDGNFELAGEFDFLKLYRYEDKAKLKQSSVGLNISNKYFLVDADYQNSNFDSNYLSDQQIDYFKATNLQNSDEFIFSDDSDFKKIKQNKVILDNLFQNSDAAKLIYQIYPEEYPNRFVLEDGLLEVNPIYPRILDKNGQNISLEGIQYDYLIDEASFVVVGNNLLSNRQSADVLNIGSINSFYEISPQELSNRYYSDEIYSAEPNDCLGGSGNYGKSIGNYPGSVVLQAIDKNICLDFVKADLLPSNSIVVVSFEVRNSSGARSLYCLQRKDGTCLNDKSLNMPKRGISFNEYKDIVYIPNDEEYTLVLINETIDKESEQFVEFKNISVTTYPVINVIKNESYENRKSQATINIEAKSFPLTIDLSVFDKFSYKYDPNEYNYNPVAKNCDNYNQKEYGRDQIDVKGMKYFEYSAIDAISCDTLMAPEIIPSSSYLINFETINKEGKGLDLCFYSPELQKCLVSERFKTGEHTIVFGPYPQLSNIQLNIGNQSIGNIKTVNALGAVSVDYIPYKFLKSIRISKNDEIIETGLKVVSTSNPHKFIHIISVNNKGDQSEVGGNSGIILNQSYEQNWALYNINDCLFIPGTKIPFYCKNAVKSHTIANNWANGWFVPNDNATYIAVFWPQYLQFIGSGLFLCFFTLLILIRLYYQIPPKRSVMVA